MGRRAIRNLTLAAMALLATTSCAHAQQGARVLPDLFAPLAVPQAEPVIANNPKAFLEPPEVSPNTGMPRFDTEQEGGNIGMVHLAIESGQWIDPRYIENSQHPDDLGIWERLCTGYGDQTHRLVQDYKNFYLSENILCVGAAILIAAPLANTHADQGIRDWYQRGAGNGRSPGADHTADVFKQFGEWKYTIPAYFVLSASGFIWDDCPALATAGEFGNRSLRALAVGAPTVGILQYGLGSDRPYTDDSSRWQPFKANHGVSGHAFVGAVPFLTAASMTDSYALKTLLVVGSFGPAWSRIHTDDHYFSQVLLGWSIAYLSVQSVNQTEDSHFRIVPVDIPSGVGMGVEVRY
jgi:PAP2 superfamily